MKVEFIYATLLVWSTFPCAINFHHWKASHFHDKKCNVVRQPHAIVVQPVHCAGLQVENKQSFAKASAS